jgi:hypothetical protein
MSEAVVQPAVLPLTRGGYQAGDRFRARFLQFRFNRRLSFWAACIVLGSFFGPAEAIIRVGISFTALRAALFAVLVPGLVLFGRKVARGGYVPVMSDFFVPLMAGWMALSLAMTIGLKGLLSIDTALILEFLSAYLIARCLFGTAAGLEQFVKVLLVVAMGLVLLGLVEEAARANVISSLASRLFHTSRTLILTAGNVTTTQYRMGLVRVRVSFEHSILYGAFFAVSAPLFFYVLQSIRLRLIALGVCLMGTLLSLSSGPMLCFAIFVSGITFDSLFWRLRWRWTFLALFCLYVLAVILLTVDQPVEALIKLGTLDPQTGIYRLRIWHWIGYNLRDSWMFGIGNKDWQRPAQMVDSVDSLWLVQSLRSGYVGVGLLALVIFSPFFVWPPRQLPTFPSRRYDQLRIAVGISILQLVFLAFAVHIWGIMWAYLAMLLGARAGLNEARFLPAEVRGDVEAGGPGPLHRSSVDGAGAGERPPRFSGAVARLRPAAMSSAEAPRA